MFHFVRGAIRNSAVSKPEKIFLGWVRRLCESLEAGLRCLCSQASTYIDFVQGKLQHLSADSLKEKFIDSFFLSVHHISFLCASSSSTIALRVTIHLVDKTFVKVRIRMLPPLLRKKISL